MNTLLDSDPANIVVVDDELDNLRLLINFLSKQGYVVRPIANSNSAMEAIRAQYPDLILLDIMMPHPDGYEICRQLKADEKTCEIPVIFISALDEVLDKVKAFNIGGADYITKPFQTEELLARIQHQLTIKQQKAQLQQLNQELKRTNAELERFSSIAAHDLQAPLQGIVSSAELLKLKYENNLNEDAIARLNRIIANSLKMKELIQDLLTYAKVGVKTEKFENINCQTVVTEALANLNDAILCKNAEITFGDLPILKGDRTLLIQLFQNLIGNSIKFSHPEVKPIINISAARHDDGKWLIEVSDNGIGIEEKDFERVFEAFQRLDSAINYPGTGIGMTICKKIVEAHNGRIWIKSQLGVGTTFYLTLPSALVENR
jgi:two-component system sensor histidine kinase/response regulator